MSFISFLLLGCFLLSICSGYGQNDTLVNTVSGHKQVIKDIPYFIGRDTLGKKQQLTLDLYLPINVKGKQRFPLFVTFHGGSYLRGDKSWQEEQCNIMTDSGFVVASVNYRLGWRLATGCMGKINSLAQAQYRGVQDAQAALRFLAANAEKFHIDTSWIFIGGESAGAAIALNSAYCSDEFMAVNYPQIRSKLGKLISRRKLSAPKYSIKGIYDKFGAICDSTLIKEKSAIPAISFHGGLDELVPCNSGYFLDCCWVPAFGPLCMRRCLQAANSFSIVYIKKNGDHMPNEFSTIFTMSRAAEFFRHIMKGDPKSAFFSVE